MEIFGMYWGILVGYTVQREEIMTPQGKAYIEQQVPVYKFFRSKREIKHFVANEYNNETGRMEIIRRAIDVNDTNNWYYTEEIESCQEGEIEDEVFCSR